MEKKINFTKWDLAGGVITTNAMQIFLDWPYEILSNSGNSFWITSILITIIASTIYGILLFLYKKNNCVGLSLFEISNNLGGVILKKIVAFICFTIFAMLISSRLQHYAGLLNVSAYNNTPIYLLMLILVVFIVISIIAGVEVLFKLMGYLFPIFVMYTIFIFVLSLDPLNLNHFTPIFGNGVVSTFTNAFIFLPTFSSLFILLFFSNSNFKYKDLKFSLITSISIVTFVVLLITTSIMVMISADKIHSYKYPLYETIRTMAINSPFTGLETQFTFIMYFVTIPYLGLISTMACHCASVLFPKVNYRLISMIIIAIAYFMATFTMKPDAIASPTGIVSLYITFVAFILPMGLLVGTNIKNSILRKKKA
ncbi:MAG: spore germination protein [Clostridia bacterium]|nr:spore germination protein [Clostridia bacterium]